MVLKALAFFSASTQYENLGDAVIFGALVDLLRPYADIRVVPADAPEGFLRSADLTESDLASSSEFGVALKSHLLQRKPRRLFIVQKGGGVADYRGAAAMKESLMACARGVAMRSLGVRYVRAGFSYSEMSFACAALERIRHRVYTALPRDRHTAELLGLHTVPRSMDLAVSSRHLYTGDEASRDRVVVSFRSLDQPNGPESYELAKQVRAIADTHELQPLPLSQVAFDDEAMTQWATTVGFDAPAVWDGTPESRDALFHQYRRTAVVVSDRLHVLLFGLYCGALPIPVVGDLRGKVASYFESNGLSRLILPVRDLERLPEHTARLRHDATIERLLAELRAPDERQQLARAINESLCRWI